MWRRFRLRREHTAKLSNGRGWCEMVTVLIMWQIWDISSNDGVFIEPDMGARTKVFNNNQILETYEILKQYINEQS